MSVLAGQLGPLGVTTRPQVADPWLPDALSPHVWVSADALDLDHGDDFVTWPDRGGSGRHFIPGSAPYSAVKFHDNVLNGLPGLRFDSSATTHIRLNTTVPTMRHIFVVASWIGAAPFPSYNGLFTATSDPLILIGASGGSTFYLHIHNPTYHRDGIAYSNNNMAVTFNGFGIYSVSSLLYGSNLYPQFGRDRSISGRYWNGYVCESLIFQSVLSDGDRQLVEGYLAHKYALAGNLPVDHPYKSGAPTL